MKVTLHLIKAALRLIPLCLILGALPACEGVKTNAGGKANANANPDDPRVQQTLDEWQEAKPSIERLTDMEADLQFLLSEVSRMSDLGSTPGLSNTSMPEQTTAPQQTATAEQTPSQHIHSAQCPDTRNTYKKSLALASFPRMQPTTSSLGQLHKVEQHLPMLLSANLRNRHAMLTPLQLDQGFSRTHIGNELATAAQAQQLARQHRVQFIISGEVDDMSMKFPSSVSAPSHYTYFVNGVHNLLHINTPLNKRSRVFTFNVQVRDGITGQVVFTNQYSTFGHWKPSPELEVGFASARFWQTDYGQQVQQLVAKASNEMAQVIQCRPYMATVDARPGQNLLVVHSGSNNGLRIGDAMDLYQVVQQPATGGYQQYDMRLIKRDTQVHLIETYPSHSVAQVADNLLMNGQYLVKAP